MNLFNHCLIKYSSCVCKNRKEKNVFFEVRNYIEFEVVIYFLFCLLEIN